MLKIMVLVLAATTAAVLVGVAFAAWPTNVQESLKTQKDIWIATRRADGSRSKAAPVWFWWDGRFLYFSTGPDTYKARRIRRGSPVFMSVAGENGPFFEGTPEIVTDLGLVERLGSEYSNKYWIAWLGLFRPRVARVSSGKTVVVKVAPKEAPSNSLTAPDRKDP